jgi:hypothetical protein
MSINFVLDKNFEPPRNPVEFATVRLAVDDDGVSHYSIECRFADGQKYAPVTVDGDHPELAQRIVEMLNSGIQGVKA